METPLNRLHEFDEPLDYYYEDEIYYEETIVDLWNNCIIPSFSSIQLIILKIIALNVICGGAISLIKPRESICHFLSGLSGIYLVSTLESNHGKFIFAVFFVLSYMLLFLLNVIETKYDPSAIDKAKVHFLSNANLVKYGILIALVLCEYHLLKPSVWIEIRGVIMVFTMKLISLAEDVDKKVIKFPTILQYFGYVLCGSNVLFGPWMPYQEYTAFLKYPPNKNIRWFFAIVETLLTSILFLMMSNCFITFMIQEDSNKWLTAYKEAFSFRASHYFVCYLSEAAMLATGYKNTKIWHNPGKWRYVITEPLVIEFPTALSIVVTNWNRPMHDFLKKYVYRSWLPLGRFYGILATFIASSCLHGFELKVSVVLISIGIFSYIQYSVRDYFAASFNCCIRVYPCKGECKHTFKREDLRCKICHIIFGLFSILHLVYLGMLMDSSADEIGIYEKWKNLYFISFWIMTFNILIIL